MPMLHTPSFPALFLAGLATALVTWVMMRIAADFGIFYVLGIPFAATVAAHGLRCWQPRRLLLGTVFIVITATWYGAFWLSIASMDTLKVLFADISDKPLREHCEFAAAMSAGNLLGACVTMAAIWAMGGGGFRPLQFILAVLWGWVAVWASVFLASGNDFFGGSGIALLFLFWQPGMLIIGFRGRDA